MYVLSQSVHILTAEGNDEQQDEQIVALVRSGDHDQFSVLYQRYYCKAFYLAFGMTGQREQAADLTQEIFLRVYESLHAFQGRSSFATWFYRIALNHCLNHCRREQRRIEIIDNNELQTHQLFSVGKSDLADSLVLRREVQECVRQALLSLKPQMRVFLLLKDVEGLSYEEIAERLQCSAGTVASGLSRARTLLARKLARLKGKI
jgi:RNA polymerase sigma-70 factor (ECF subfamily)